jgi:hypothetical protein
VGPGHDSSQPRATTLGQQQHLTPPRGRLRGRHVSRESDILQGINSESGPHGKVSDTWIYSPDLQVGPGPPRVRTGPLEWDSDPPYGVRATHTRDPRFQGRTHPGLNQGPGG